VLIAIPIVTDDAFLADQLGKFFLYGIFALSVDLVWGYGGMFTFGQAAFFGWAGYIVGMLTVRETGILPVPFWIALVAAVAAVALLALGLGYFVFSGRLALRGVYFAVVTLAVAVLSERLANAGGEITGGQNGILLGVPLGIPGVFHFDRDYGFYAFTGALLLATYVFLRWFVSSPMGLVLRGIGQNEDRVALLGYDVAAIKRRALVISSALAGVAGALFHVHDGIVSPAAVGVELSTLVLLWVALGGRGTLIGPVVGAVCLSYLNSRLSGTLLNTWLLVVGAVLVAVIVVFPAGLFGWLNRAPARRAET
jgi:ABC-type branched-subunit amino acid transport system permease subunit